MTPQVEKQLLYSYQNEIKPSFTGSLQQWAYDNLILPNSFAQPGRVNISASPYLIEPANDLLNPKIRQINLIAAVQTGKSVLSEFFIPYLVINNPGPILRMHQNDDAAKFFNTTRLSGILENCEAIKPLLQQNRYTVKRDAVALPHMTIRCTGPSENYLHGVSVRTLILDEAHVYEPGVIAKAIARTNAFAQNRKIVICSQPNTVDTDLHRAYESGNIYEWQWCCPKCKQYQPFKYSHRRDDGTYSGLNWDTILNDDRENTNIALSAKTAWLECHHCCHKVTDTIANRRLLNDTGKYICIKNDGDPAVRSYTWPGFVNVGLSFEYFAIQGMTARRTMKHTGLKTDWINFINQVYGKFYKEEPVVEQSKIAIGDYDKNTNNGIRIMTVDVQRKGNLKYYVVRQWNKEGTESKRIAYGVVRSWEEVDETAKKYGVNYPCVGVDSGDGESTVEVYAQTVKHGKPVRLANGSLHYASWVALKGDQKAHYKHKDGLLRLFSEEVHGDPQLPNGDPHKGIPAKLYLWSNFSVKTILSKLRDGDIPGIKWLVDSKDNEYEQQMYSEGLVDVIDKKTGVSTPRWIKKNNDNHYFDCECMNLAMAIMYNCFTATNVDSSLIAVLSKEEITNKQEKSN